MKKAFLISAIALFVSLPGYAASTVKYCDLIVYRLFLKNYVAEMHTDSNMHTQAALIRDAGGDKIKFAMPADALNYVAREGWELVAAYAEHGGQTHFLLKKQMP
jgi:hypothetical protein